MLQTPFTSGTFETPFVRNEELFYPKYFTLNLFYHELYYIKFIEKVLGKFRYSQNLQSPQNPQLLPLYLRNATSN